MVQRCCMIITTTNSRQVVSQISTRLLEEELAACVQVDSINSYFKWEGKIASELEYRVVIKAKSENYNKIEKIITQIHNYDLPQIIKLEIQGGLAKYLNWVTKGEI